MLAVNYSQFRDNMNTNLDLVSDDFETLFVTRKENRNVVVISEAAYNNLLESIHVMGNKANYDWIMASKAQLEAGKYQVHELSEDKDE